MNKLLRGGGYSLLCSLKTVLDAQSGRRDIITLGRRENIAISILSILIPNHT